MNVDDEYVNVVHIQKLINWTPWMFPIKIKYKNNKVLNFIFADVIWKNV